MLQSCDERKLHRLPLLVAGLGPRVRVLESQLPVGHGLDPDRLAHGSPRLAPAGLGWWGVVDRQHPRRAPPDRVKAGVRRYPVQPCAYRTAPVEARKPPPRSKKRVLERILGVVKRTEHAVTVGVQARPVR